MRSGIASKALQVVNSFFSQPEYASNYMKILDYATWAGTRLEDRPAFYAELSPRNVKPSSENYVPPSKRAKLQIDYGHPVGLVGLVCAAIKQAFRYYVKLEGGPWVILLTKDNKKFSEEMWGNMLWPL
ncbi:hypothetical protein E1B28_010908 [Marasmius oreades]|uniref:Uncharacterized protein n=1 Tax=Marasmius oreades TaxID=181124 RepID=A0A9P7UQN3_9AGAR|nr:uncharacterized protein E1B28_010908 [Marasmius oreades]KAG7089206.1 hypothetical protein E1B28_010908 [Marasmius oreades]